MMMIMIVMPVMMMMMMMMLMKMSKRSSWFRGGVTVEPLLRDPIRHDDDDDDDDDDYTVLSAGLGHMCPNPQNCLFRYF